MKPKPSYLLADGSDHVHAQVPELFSYASRPACVSDGYESQTALYTVSFIS